MARYPGNFTDSELLTLPRNLRTSPDGLDSQLAYVTQPEIDMIVKANPHGSMQGKPNRGPEGVPSLDGDYGTFAPSPSRPSSGSSGGGGSWGGEREDRGGGESQQDIINRNNKNRIDKIKENQRKEEIAAAGRQWDPRADDWKKDYSHSTRDVRSSADDREDFRIRTKQVKYVGEGDQRKRLQSTGHYVETPAEKMALLMTKLTGNPKYMNMPIFVPKGVSYEEQLALVELGKNDPQKFIDTITKFEDITAGNPNLDFQQGFGTGYDDWYKPQPLQGGGGGGWGGWGGWGGYGGGGGGGGGYGYSGGQDPMQQGYQRGKVGPGTLQEQVNQIYLGMSNINPAPGFQKSRGGIVSLLRLS